MALRILKPRGLCYVWPAEGVVLRVRSPAWPQKKTASATIGAKPADTGTIDVAEETVLLVATVITAAMQSIVVMVGL